LIPAAGCRAVKAWSFCQLSPRRGWFISVWRQKDLGAGCWNDFDAPIAGMALRTGCGAA
jgi:hypothetical protein